MTRSRLLLAVAAVLAGAAALFVVLGAVFNLLLVAAAVPFGAAASLLWYHATGRLAARVRRRSVEREAYERQRRATRSTGAGPGGDRATRWTDVDGPARSMGRREALEALGLSREADQGTIRRAYRDRVKTVHPDAEDGDEDEFRRVRTAYERLRTRGKG